MENLMNLLITHGGKIVSSNSLDSEEIRQAQASKRMWVNQDGFGFVWLPYVNLFEIPVTVQQVKMFEKWYPLDVPLPASLKNPPHFNPIQIQVTINQDGSATELNEHPAQCTCQPGDFEECPFMDFVGGNPIGCQIAKKHKAVEATLRTFEIDNNLIKFPQPGTTHTAEILETYPEPREGIFGRVKIIS